MHAPWPLVGRQRELAQLTAVLDSGRPGAMLIGAPGVGKSRLALELLHRAAASGHPTLRVMATQATSALPLGAFAAVLPPAGRLPRAAPGPFGAAPPVGSRHGQPGWGRPAGAGGG